MLGIGTDICSIERINILFKKDEQRLLNRLLTPQERIEQEWTPPALARRWAAKEAIAKAFGQGIGANIGFQEIEIKHSSKGAPQVAIQGMFAQAKVHLSISDDAGVAVAFAIVESLE